MITITMHKNKNQRYTGFTIDGHAGYSEAGSDIVCAGISALSETALLGLIQYLQEENVSYEVKDGFLSVRVKAPCDTSQVILTTLVLGLQQIVQQYPEYAVLNS